MESPFGSKVGPSPSERPEVMFLDLAWGGLEGQATYPPSVNGKIVRSIENPDGKPILKIHDTQQLRQTLRHCRQQNRQPNTTGQHRCVIMHIRMRPIAKCVAAHLPLTFAWVTDTPDSNTMLALTPHSALRQQFQVCSQVSTESDGSRMQHQSWRSVWHHTLCQNGHQLNVEGTCF